MSSGGPSQHPPYVDRKRKRITQRKERRYVPRVTPDHIPS